MSGKQITNIPASVHRRLLDLARSRGEALPIMLNRYVAERFLYRLSLTEHRNHFLLKGAVLLAVWSDQPYRQTKDIDMLGMGDGSIPRIEKVFREVCAVPSPDDGLLLDATTL